jgi:dTDP-4-dehydrorhamnose reductase
LKILIFGADGMLGTDLVKTFSDDYEVIQSLEKDLDITSRKAVEDRILALKPAWVINSAAYTDVDGAETNREKAFAVNSTGVENIALACTKAKAKLIHFSTDYVFDGTKKEPYTETDPTNPINVYGASKLEGEKKVQKATKEYYILRTQWLYGKNGKNFVYTVLKLFSERDELRIVNDQIGSPTYTVDLAKATREFIEVTPPFGIYNVSNSGHCSWYDFALEIALKIKKTGVKITPVSSEEFPRPAKRPKNSRLDRNKFEKVHITPMRRWESALRGYISLK